MKPRGIRQKFSHIWAPIWEWIAERCATGIQWLFSTLRTWARNNHLTNQFKAAVFVASAVILIDEAHLLEQLKDDFLRLSISVTSFLAVAASNTDDNLAHGGSADIVVVLLDDLDYEQRFGQASPLNRQVLTEMISNLLGGATPPKVLAIDLDLSPSPQSAPNQDLFSQIKAENALYCALQGYSPNEATYCPQSLVKATSANAPKIVLITPQPVFSSVLVDAKIAWIEQLCSVGIQFGLPDIMSSQGLVMGYQGNKLSFIHEVARAGGEQPQSRHNTICNDSKLQRMLMEKYSPLPNEQQYSSKVEPLNFDFERHIKVVDYRDLCRINSSCDVSSLAGKVVFFGGHYGLLDVYETPLGDMSGVQLHGASYYSLRNPVSKVAHLQSYLLEILFGTAIGISFYRLACSFHRRKSIISLLANLSLPLFLVLVGTLVNGVLIRYQNVSLNLAPLVFGMFIHISYVRLEPSPNHKLDDSALWLGIPEKSIKTAL